MATGVPTSCSPTMIWIGLLIMLAGKLNQYGMVSWFGKEFSSYLTGMPGIAIYVLVGGVYFFIHYFFASATAHISALFPLSLALLAGGGVPVLPAAPDRSEPVRSSALPPAAQRERQPHGLRFFSSPSPRLQAPTGASPPGPPHPERGAPGRCPAPPRA